MTVGTAQRQVARLLFDLHQDEGGGPIANFGILRARLVRCDAIEYGLIAAGIAVAIIEAVFALGDEIETFFQGVQPQLAAKQPG